jgi:hypothetical protein
LNWAAAGVNGPEGTVGAAGTVDLITNTALSACEADLSGAITDIESAVDDDSAKGVDHVSIIFAIDKEWT